MSESILIEAERLTNGDRQESYGHPLDDWTAIGRMQAAILSRWLRQYVPDLPAEISTLLMEPVKISREVHRPKRDNRTDGAGYWNLVQLIEDERKRRSIYTPALGGYAAMRARMG